MRTIGALIALATAIFIVFWYDLLQMKESNDIPHIAKYLKFENLDGQIRELLPFISDDFASDVSIEKLTAGTANLMYKCKESKSNATILVRVFGEGASLLCNRTQEVEMIKLFYRQGLGSKVYATFENGYILEYMEGKTLKPEDIRDPYFYIPIARKLGQLHQYKQEQKGGSRGIFEMIQFWFSMCKKLLPKDDVKTSDHLQVVELELKNLEANLLKQYGHQPLVFSHNDLNYANILYNQDKNGGAEITLLDFEYAGFNYRGFDLGNHFCEWAGQGDIDWNNYPSHETMKIFLRNYLESNSGTSDIKKEEIDALIVETERWAQVSHIAWHIWALAMAQAENKVTTDFDYKKYSFTRWDEYVRRKEQLNDIL